MTNKTINILMKSIQGEFITIIHEKKSHTLYVCKCEKAQNYFCGYTIISDKIIMTGVIFYFPKITVWCDMLLLFIVHYSYNQN